MQATITTTKNENKTTITVYIPTARIPVDIQWDVKGVNEDG